MPHRILIIDDEDDIREVAAMSLETVAGWEVMVANSGAQGLTRAATYKPDAILLDVMMPGMDGPTTFRELRKNPVTAKIPVLFLTAKVQATDRRRFADLGIGAGDENPLAHGRDRPNAVSGTTYSSGADESAPPVCAAAPNAAPKMTSNVAGTPATVRPVS